MASTLVLTIKSEKTQAQVQDLLQVGSEKDAEGGRAVEQFIKDVRSKVHRGVIDVQTASAAPVAAAGTFTLVSAIATDAITIGTVTLTASSTPADEDEFEIDGADDDADAASLADAINDHSVLSKVVVATVADNVVTVTSIVKGVIGNQLPISSADATITASGSFLEGGTGGATDTAHTYTFGI